MIADTDIQRAAKALVECQGDEAMAVAHERVAAHTTSQDQSGLNIASMIVLVRR